MKFSQVQTVSIHPGGSSIRPSVGSKEGVKPTVLWAWLGPALRTYVIKLVTLGQVS